MTKCSTHHAHLHAMWRASEHQTLKPKQKEHLHADSDKKSGLSNRHAQETHCLHCLRRQKGKHVSWLKTEPFYQKRHISADAPRRSHEAAAYDQPSKNYNCFLI